MKFIVSCLLIIASGCKKDFLVTSPSEISTYITKDEYVVDINTTRHFLNGLYVNLGVEFYHGYNALYPEIIADNVKPVSGSEAFVTQYSWTQFPDEVLGGRVSAGDFNMNCVWTAGYHIIRDCAIVIEKAHQYENQNKELAQNIIGQAIALRGFIHFMLVNIFSQHYTYTADASHMGVPYVLVSDITQPVSRGTVAEVYAAVIKDLKEAIELLTGLPGDAQHMNSMAAKALLARVYLFQEKYTEARNEALQVTDQVPLCTADYPDAIFKNANSFQDNEALFQLSPSWVGVNGSQYNTFFAGIYVTDPLYQFVATKDLYDLIHEDELDKRNTWIAGENEITKFPIDVISGFPYPTAAYFHTILRSSEMFLTVAEASAKLQDEPAAREYLDAIRQRSNAALPATSLTGNELLELIYTERRKELCFEGLRMFDLQRLKRGVSRTDPSMPDFSSLPYPSDKAIAPIPGLDVTLSGLQQNSGYSN